MVELRIETVVPWPPPKTERQPAMSSPRVCKPVPAKRHLSISTTPPFNTLIPCELVSNVSVSNLALAAFTCTRPATQLSCVEETPFSLKVLLAIASELPSAAVIPAGFEEKRHPSAVRRLLSPERLMI